MKHFIVCILLFSFFNNFAQTPVLVRDINPGRIGVTFNNIKNDKRIQIDDVIYFIVRYGGNDELYSIKNGEVQLISTVCSGTCYPLPINFVKYGNKLVFIKIIDSKYRQLWITDGTLNGTSLVYEYENAILGGFGVGNNNKLYFEIGSSIDNKTSIYITDGTQDGTRKISSGLDFSPEEQFGAPVGYGNGIAFANIIGDSLRLMMFDDENLIVLSSMEVRKGTDICGLKNIHTDDIVLLLHNPNASLSALYKYSSGNGQISKEMDFPLELNRYPHFKDYGKDTLLLHHPTGGQSLLTGNPLTTITISNAKTVNLSYNKYYYTYDYRSAFYISDKSQEWSEPKVILFDKDVNKKTFDSKDVQYDLIGYKDYTFMASEPINTQGEIVMYNLKDKTAKTILSLTNQSFSSNGIHPMGLIGSKLYFLGNLNQDYGKELYYIETGIPTSTKEIISESNVRISVKNHIIHIESAYEYQEPLQVGIFDTSGKMVQQLSIPVNTDYYLKNNNKGLFFVQITDPKINHQKAVPVFIH